MSHHPPLALFAVEPIEFEDDSTPCAHAIVEQALCALGIADTLTSRPLSSILIDRTRFAKADANLPERILIAHDEEETVSFGALSSTSDVSKLPEEHIKSMAHIHVLAEELGEWVASNDGDDFIRHLISTLDDLIGTMNIKRNYAHLSLLFTALFMKLYGINNTKDFIAHLSDDHIDSDSLMNEINDFLNNH